MQTALQTTASRLDQEPPDEEDEPEPAPAPEVEGGILRKAGQQGTSKSVQFGGEAVDEGLGEGPSSLSRGGVPYTKTSSTLNPLKTDEDIDLTRQSQAARIGRSRPPLTQEQAEGKGADFEALQRGKPRDPASAAKDIYDRKQALTPAQAEEFDARAEAEGASHPETGSYAHEDAIMSDIEERASGPKPNRFASMYDR